MIDLMVRERLLASLPKGHEEVWSIIQELAALPELDRRRILRPHEDAGFSAQEAVAMDQRSRLDKVLGFLTLVELGQELGLLGKADIPLAETAGLVELLRSEGFLRYVNAYLYFGIRFLAATIDPPPWWMHGTEPVQLKRDSNQRLIALKTPPDLRDSAGASVAVGSFLDLQPTEVSEALRFLDGFTAKDDLNRDNDPEFDEPEHLDLWLQGLWPELSDRTSARFTALSDGLKQWALNRCDFYMSLEPVTRRKQWEEARARTPSPGSAVASAPPAISAELGDSYKGRRPGRGWSITNPLAARFGVADVYWIARLLRADVSADAKVTYKHTSWLRLLSLQAARRGESQSENVLREAEEILRSVFDFTCDLIQNAVEITSHLERLAFQPELRVDLPGTTAGWRDAFDEESTEIESQRRQRCFRGAVVPSGSDKAHNSDVSKQSDNGWSRRVLTGEHPANLIRDFHYRPSTRPLRYT